MGVSPEFSAGSGWDLLTGRKVSIDTNGALGSLSLGEGEALVIAPSQDSLTQLESVLDRPYDAVGCSDEQRLKGLAAELDESFGAGDLAQLRSDPSSYCRIDGEGGYSRSVRWRWPRDLRREILIPPDHALVVESEQPFALTLKDRDARVWRRPPEPTQHPGESLHHRAPTAPAPGRTQPRPIEPYQRWLPPRPRARACATSPCGAATAIVLLPRARTADKATSLPS